MKKRQRQDDSPSQGPQCHSQDHQLAVNAPLSTTSSDSLPITTLPPELFLLLSHYLAWHDITVCLRISKEWYHAFLPSLWTKVQVRVDFTSPTFAQLIKHAALVQELVLHIQHRPNFLLGNDEDDDKDNNNNFDSLFEEPERLFCPNLSKLDIIDADWNAPPPDPESEQSLADFIRAHAGSLKQLSYWPRASDKVLDVIQECSSLQKLYLRLPDGHTLDQWSDRYDTLWSKQRSLAFYGSGAQGNTTGTIHRGVGRVVGNHQPHLFDPLLAERTVKLLDRLSGAPPHGAVVTTRIRELNLTTRQYDGPMIQAMLLLILNSPDLVRLQWNLRAMTTEPGTLTLLAQVLTQSRRQSHGQDRSPSDSSSPSLSSPSSSSDCKGLLKLESLSLPWANVSSNEYRDFKHLLESLPSLKKLFLPSTNFGQTSWQCLVETAPRLLSTLTTLDFHNCYYMTGADVHTILCSVASLEDFEAGVITDTAILADDRPWICASRLRRLTVAVVLLDPKQSQDLILGRLARLENLRSLNLDMRYLPFYTHQLPDIPPAQAWEKISLQWTLDQGLDQLKHLRRLERLTGPRYQWIVTPLWDQTEARWALEHWVSLKELEGIRLDDEAHKILRPHIRACVEEPHVLV